MCDKCLKRAIGRLIIDTESRLQEVFKKVDSDPSLKYDAEFVRLANSMAFLLEKLESIK